MDFFLKKVKKVLKILKRGHCLAQETKFSDNLFKKQKGH